ncbi:MAG: hypothetical protein C0593_04460 [Marinilabiliales bacterium]|nr:MAG: hypothetical protein C0593_04460 [Marinilabiliales bacterium]
MRLCGKKQSRKYASRLIIEINKKLENGWSPFYETDSVPEYIMLKNACQSFISVKRKEGRREDTVRMYESFFRILDEYIERVLGRDDMYIYAFTDQI